MEVILNYFSGFTTMQLDQFAALERLYSEWNKKINVISRKDIDNFYIHHVLHSLSIAAVFDFVPGMRVLDLGCGGGFPGVPLAIFFPDVQFHLVDSIQKKLTVVKAICTELEIKNITVQHTRAEDIKDKKFDVVVSRAVAPLKELWHWSKPLLNKANKTPSPSKTDLPMAGGLICLKGGDLTKEIAASDCRPKIWEIEKLFTFDYFHEKYVLQVI